MPFDSFGAWEDRAFEDGGVNSGSESHADGINTPLRERAPIGDRRPFG